MSNKLENINRIFKYILLFSSLITIFTGRSSYLTWLAEWPPAFQKKNKNGNAGNTPLQENTKKWIRTNKRGEAQTKVQSIRSCCPFISAYFELFINKTSPFHDGGSKTTANFIFLNFLGATIHEGTCLVKELETGNNGRKTDDRLSLLWSILRYLSYIRAYSIIGVVMKSCILSVSCRVYLLTHWRYLVLCVCHIYNILSI